MASLKLHLFGGLKILFDDTRLSGLSKKEQALLSYLAVTRRNWSRETLSGLLWSEVDEDKARKSLGVALTHMRRHLPEHLHITRQEIGLKQTPAYWLDVSVFLQAIPVQSENEFEPVELLAQTELSPESAAQLKKAVDLYQGYFLDGFSVIHAPLFEEWVFNKREQFHILAIQGLYRLAGDALQRTAYAEAVAYLRRLINLDPLQEEAQRYLMLAHARLGQRGAAIQQYETCRRLLLDELGLTPMPQTTALYEQIQTGDFTLAEPQNGPAVYLPGRYNLPAEVTSFVGRETELADLVHKLKSSDQRLFTLVGPGGAGKTRLAIAAAGHLTDQFAGGIWFVPLANLSTPAPAETPALLAAAMATALEFSFSGPKSPPEQILNYLRRIASPTLFIFDNFEPYLFDAGFLLEILQVTPSVTLLLTSRSRLNFQSEHVIPVTGLPVPPVIYHPEAATYDSVQLFVQRAAQQESGFTLTSENLPSVARLCQLVQGSPLAIELATTRLPELTCAEIVARLQQDIDVLTTSLQDIPVRHQSIRAVFEQAWQLLSEPEQLLLAQISPFYGAISPQAAQAVTRIEAKYLKTLVQKFLLQEISAEHYELHSLLRQFAREKLQGFIAQEVLNETDVWENYSLYHLNLARLSAGSDYLMENLRQAWLWIVDQARFDLIEQYTAGVAHQFVSAGLFEDGESAFRATLDKVRPVSSSPETTDPAYLTASAALLWAQALFLNRMTRYEAAAAAAQTTVSLARQTGHHHWQAAGHLQWGYACYYGADYEAAQAQFEQVILLSGNQATPEIAAALHGLGGIYSEYAGDHVRAADYLQRALYFYQQLADGRGQAEVHHSVGIVGGWLTNCAEAEDHFQRALHLYRDLNLRSGAAAVQISRAVIQAGNDKLTEALIICQQARQIYQTIGDHEGEIIALGHLGIIAEKSGDSAEARRYFDQASQINPSGNFQVLQTIPLLPALSQDMR